MKNRKLAKYLKEKDPFTYTKQEVMLKKYVDGFIDSAIKYQGFTNSNSFCVYNKDAKFLDITFRYYNISCIITFYEESYNYKLLDLTESKDEYFSAFYKSTNLNYESDFSFSNLLKQIKNEITLSVHFKNNSIDKVKKHIYDIYVFITIIIFLVTSLLIFILI